MQLCITRRCKRAAPKRSKVCSEEVTLGFPAATRSGCSEFEAKSDFAGYSHAWARTHMVTASVICQVGVISRMPQSEEHPQPL